MSFYGKKFKKVNIGNYMEMINLMEVIDAGDNILNLISQTDALTSFVKNSDGTISYLVEVNGEELLNQKVKLNEETDFVTPDGSVTKNTFTEEGNTLKTIMKYPGGKIIRFERKFEGKNMTLIVTVDGADVAGVVYYEAV